MTSKPFLELSEHHEVSLTKLPIHVANSSLQLNEEINCQFNNFMEVSGTIASLYENKTDKAKKGNQIQHVRTHNGDLHIKTP